MTSEPANSDTTARSTAVDVRRSVVVQAPAGSGKTTLLVDRFVNLLGVVERPEEILAITFTRKAAAEMQDRILSAISEDTPSARAVRTRDARLGWQLTLQPSRLRIQTIDAFCAALAHRLPLTSGLSEGHPVAEDASVFYDEAIDHVFARLRTADPLNAELIRALALFDNDYARARASLRTMLSRRDQWLDVVASTLRAGRSGEDGDSADAGQAVARAIEHGIQSLHQSAIGDIEANLNGHQRSELAAVAASLAARLGRSWPRPDLPEELDDWRFIADLLTTREGKPRSRFGKAQGFDDSASANRFDKLRAKAMADDLAASGLTESLASLRNLPAARLAPGDAVSIVAITTALALAAIELGDVFRRHRIIDFAELTFAAQRALGDADAPTDLALALDYRIKHLLLDEFQDTSAAQFRLISRLLQEWHGDATRSLFIVGDPMQSIYRFRDADVALFQRTRHAGIALLRPDPVELTSNFRSSPPIVDWCNRVFATAFGSVEDPVIGRVAFAESRAVKPARAGDGCHVVVVASDENDADESGVILDRIRQIRADRPDESIAILGRNRDHLTQLLARLSATGIPWVGTDIHALSARPVISDLMCLVKALSSDDDRLAWLSVLRAPFVGLQLRDLEAIVRSADHPAGAARNGTWDIGLSEDGRARLRRVRPVFQDAERSRGQMRTRAWIEGTFIRLGGADAYADTEAAAHVERFLNVLDEGHARTLDVFALERSVARLFAESTRSPGAIDVMTIHRAKGLEFDHVIVPGLHRPGRSDDPPTILWRPEGDGLLLGVPGGDDERSVYRWLRHEERHREANEQIRLLYVAATRARRSLQLFAVLRGDPGTLTAPPARSLLSQIWTEVAHEVEVVHGERGTPERVTGVHKRRVLPASYRWTPPTAD
jgi:ATP-dependent helicase/nuclease subunit A